MFWALVRGKLPKLATLAHRDIWHKNINDGEKSWDIEYAIAYFGVAYVSDHYGVESVLQILSHISKVRSYDEAIQEATSIDGVTLGDNISSALLIKGLFGLYLPHTIFLSILLLIGVWTALSGWNALQSTGRNR